MWADAAAGLLVAPHRFGLAGVVGHHDVQVAITIDVAERHGVAVAGAETGGHGMGAEAGEAVVEPLGLGLAAVVGYNGVEVAVLVQVAQRNGVAVATPEAGLVGLGREGAASVVDPD